MGLSTPDRTHPDRILVEVDIRYRILWFRSGLAADCERDGKKDNDEGFQGTHGNASFGAS